MKLVLAIIITSFLIAGTIGAGEIKDRSEEIIYSVYEKSDISNAVKFVIPKKIKSMVEKKCRQRFFKDYVYYWKITDGDSIKAIAVLDNALGKSMPMTFLVIFNLDGEIIKSEIVKYREQYGGGVANEHWNSQFKNKDAESSYEIGKDISGISGATISVKSITKGIRKLSLIFDSIKSSL